MTKIKTFKWCGLNWSSAMEGGRIIHTGQPWMWYDEEQVKLIANNALEFSIVKKPKHVVYWDGKEYDPQYATGIIRSQETLGYGTYRAVIRLPRGKKLWPSFWLVGEDKWPDNGELDIMEAWSDKDGKYCKLTIPQFPYLVPNYKVTDNVHYATETNSHAYTGSRSLPMIVTRNCHTYLFADPGDNFMTYEVKWTPNDITFYVDGVVIRKYGVDVAKYIRDKKMHVIFNTWLDEDGGPTRQPMTVKSFEYIPLN